MHTYFAQSLPVMQSVLLVVANLAITLYAKHSKTSAFKEWGLTHQRNENRFRAIRGRSRSHAHADLPEDGQSFFIALLAKRGIIAPQLDRWGGGIGGGNPNCQDPNNFNDATCLAAGVAAWQARLPGPPASIEALGEAAAAELDELNVAQARDPTRGKINVGDPTTAVQRLVQQLFPAGNMQQQRDDFSSGFSDGSDNIKYAQQTFADRIRDQNARLTNLLAVFADKTPVEIAKIMEDFRRSRAGTVPVYGQGLLSSNDQATITDTFERFFKTCAKKKLKVLSANQDGFLPVQVKGKDAVVAYLQPSARAHMTLAPIDVSGAEYEAIADWANNPEFFNVLEADMCRVQNALAQYNFGFRRDLESIAEGGGYGSWIAMLLRGNSDLGPLLERSPHISLLRKEDRADLVLAGLTDQEAGGALDAVQECAEFAVTKMGGGGGGFDMQKKIKFERVCVGGLLNSPHHRVEPQAAVAAMNAAFQAAGTNQVDWINAFKEKCTNGQPGNDCALVR